MKNSLTSATELPRFELKLLQKSQIAEAKTSSALQLVEQDLLVLQDRAVLVGPTLLFDQMSTKCEGDQ